MSLETRDLELIERIVYKNNDDFAVSIARSFERLQERIDASESRIATRISCVEDRIEASRQDAVDMTGEVRDEVREFMRIKEGSMME